LVGDEFAGYRMRAVLGRGGMSVVYQAENLRLNNVIALKVLAPELAADDVFRARFLEESRIAASLNHPNVIPIYDMGSSNGLLYIAMRYVSGTDLRQMIKKRGRLQPENALFLLGQVARALDAAHRKGLVHRDVKPGNMLIERGSDEGDPDHVYLADFGITKHAMSRTGLTSTGQFLGTIDYVAPEQIRGTSVLGLADQYSLGCVLYECLTGRVPFEKDLDAAIIWAHVEETPAMPTVLRPDLPPEIDDVFGRVLSKQPGGRYRSCREFIDAARMALGIFGRGTDSLAYGVTTTGLDASAPPGRHAGAPPERYSWSSPPVHGYAADPAPPPVGQPQGPRWYRRPRWIAVLAAMALVLAGVGTWAGLSGSGSHAKGATTMPSMSAKATQKPAASALMNALALADKSGDATGKLPPATCKQDTQTHATCTGPVPGVSGVVFQTYPSLKALYAAYTAKVTSLNSSQFRQNFNDCGAQGTYGEVGWNHLFQHTKAYSVDQMTMGMVKDDQAAGRVFCNYTQGLEYMVWTQNDGRLMGYVAGPVHTNVWDWWVAVHHNIGIGGTPMNM
jgi:serine/threonine-protein kinase